MITNIKRELFSGLFGGLVFLIVFYFGESFLISILCGFVVFCLGYLFIKNKKESIVITSEASDGTNNNPTLYFEKLQNYRKIIVDAEMKTYVTKLIELASNIIKESDNTSYEEKITKDLINYYLPSLCSVLQKYIKIEKNNLSSPDIIKFIESVKLFLQELIICFEKQLEAVFNNEIFDAKVEMDVVKNILKGDGFTENQDFNMKL